MPSLSFEFYTKALITAIAGVILAAIVKETGQFSAFWHPKASSSFSNPTSPAVHTTIFYATLPGDGNRAATRNVTRLLTQNDFMEATRRGERFMDASSGAVLTSWNHLELLAPAGAYIVPPKSHAPLGKPVVSVELLHDEGQQFSPFIWPPRSIGHSLKLNLSHTHKNSQVPGTRGPMTLTSLRSSPKLFYVENFLSDKEAEDLIEFAQDRTRNPYHLRPSTTGHKSWTQGGDKSTNNRRTSENGFDVSSETGKRIKRRAFQLARIDPYDEKMADGIQVLRYEPGQAYVRTPTPSLYLFVSLQNIMTLRMCIP